MTSTTSVREVVVGFPERAMPPGSGDVLVVGGMSIERSVDPVPVFRINATGGALFPLHALGDRSVVCADEALYDPPWKLHPDGATSLPAAAIDEVRPTDVHAFKLDNVALHAGILPTSRRLSSLRDPRHVVLRRGCQVALDLQPDQMQAGLQPIRVHDSETRRVSSPTGGSVRLTPVFHEVA